MTRKPEDTVIYHITDVSNLQSIIQKGGLLPDSAPFERTTIGNQEIKSSRLTKDIHCCQGIRVGDCVPFYFCPRSVMLYTINKGKTGKPEGCQSTIIHLVSLISVGLALKKPWAISDGNAAAAYTVFSKSLSFINQLKWEAIEATNWSKPEIKYAKAAEFLVAHGFPWTGFHEIGCHNEEVAKKVRNLLQSNQHQPSVVVRQDWYY